MLNFKNRIHRLMKKGFSYSKRFFNSSNRPSPKTNTVVFIIGITRRSGTNFLFNLLVNHPKCQPAHIPNEDNLLLHSHLLKEYIDKTTARRRDYWQGMTKKEFETQLTGKLGSALSDFLIPDTAANKTIITKTPFTKGLENIFTLFPNSKLIILTREGKNAVESGVQSGFWNHEEGMNHWSENANDIIAFQQKSKEHIDKYRVIKYEDLFLNTTTVLRELFDFCGLDATKMSEELINNLPIKGSSQHKTVEGRLDWSPQKRTADFKPLARAAHWDEQLNDAYHKICSEIGLQLGYYEEN